MNTLKFKMAQTILGDDFISPQYIHKCQQISYTEEQIKLFENTIPSREILEWCRVNGFILCAGPNRPLSLLEITFLNGNNYCQQKNDWFTEEVFIEVDKIETRWVMFRKEPVCGSTSKNWIEQQALLSDFEMTPNIAEVAWCVAMYSVVQKIYLLQNMFVRTSSLASDGSHVYIGTFSEHGFSVGNWCGDDGHPDGIGLSVIRKY